MPNYDFECPNCGNEVERLVPMAERNRQRCDICNANETLKVQFSIPSARVFVPFVTDDPSTGKQVEINSTGEHKRLLDANGLFKDGVNDQLGHQEHNPHSESTTKKRDRDHISSLLRKARKEVYADRQSGTGSFDPETLQRQGITIKG